MKLRSITLQNVRRFGGRQARIGPFCDGLTTVCAPNESGKSTFFDALHALLFQSHTTMAAQVRALQPYAGGPVGVAAEIEFEDGVFQVQKRFMASRHAQVHDGAGRLIAQAGEAETWIQERIRAGVGAASGLLWVRQGLREVDPSGTSTAERSERDRLRDARQELMSSVSGQIDAVTGGRRLDRILRRCQDEIDRLATTTLRPRAGGPWALQEREVGELEVERDRLVGLVRDLGEALHERARLERERMRLADPATADRREAEINTARDALHAARSHADRIESAGRDLNVLRIELGRIEEESSRLRHAREKRTKRDRRIAELETELAEANAHLEACEELGRSAGAEQKDAESVHEMLSAKARTARKAAEVAEGKRRLREAKTRLERIRGLEVEGDAARALLQESFPTRADLSDIEELQRRCAAADLHREAGAASFAIQHAGQARANWNGQAVTDGSCYRILAESRIELPGFGHMTLWPAQPASIAEDADMLRSELAARLDGFGVGSVSELRVRLDEVDQARETVKSIDRAIDAIAPEGVADLAALVRTLEVKLQSGSPDGEAPAAADTEGLSGGKDTVETVEAALEEASKALQAARQLWDVRRAASEMARRSAGEIRVALELSQADAADDPEPDDEEELLTELVARRAAITQEIQDAQCALEGLKGGAADVDLAKSHYDRLVSAKENAAREREICERSLSELAGRIRARAEDAVEEKLAEVEERLERAQERSARYQTEVQALVRLRDELVAARQAAQDTYFEPIKRELQPLLAHLHPGATIEMDGDRMLVGRIVRNGIEDPADVLSGGTAEQIAILTRMAFARLYGRDGRHVPVILDDALVHTDDDRIGSMFTLLTHIARDQQVIFLSCRNRTLAELGGTRVDIELAGL